MAICSTFGVPGRKAHPRENFDNNAFPPQDTSVREERVLARLLVIGYTPARVLLILIIRNGTGADELRPIFDVIPLVDEVVAVPSCF
jgi:hypothetical protein